jgi:hypothetical protein
MDEFDFPGFLWRLLFAVALVLLTFNPTGHSYYHWLAEGFPSVSPVEAIAGILQLIGWIFFVRSTLAAMGVLGVGMSWSHIRRRLSGQAAVDRIDQ